MAVAYDSTISKLPTYTDGTGLGVLPALDVFTASINDSGKALKTAIGEAASNPNDPTNLIKMQAAMATFNTSLMVASSVVKSVEETAKSLTQKL